MAGILLYNVVGKCVLTNELKHFEISATDLLDAKIQALRLGIKAVKIKLKK